MHPGLQKPRDALNQLLFVGNWTTVWDRSCRFEGLAELASVSVGRLNPQESEARRVERL